MSKSGFSKGKFWGIKKFIKISRLINKQVKGSVQKKERLAVFGDEGLKQRPIEMGGVVVLDVLAIAFFEVTSNIGKKVATPRNAAFEKRKAQFREP